MSLPFTYVAVEFDSNDGKAHDVQVYFDMSGGKTSPPFNVLISKNVR